MAAAVSSGPRYAPEDPTLPKPWKGLVDGNTGYLYFWNPETNITQYERPVASAGPALSPAPKSTSVPISSSVQIHQPSHGHQRSSIKEENGRYNGDSNGGRNQQSMRGGGGHSDNIPNGSVSSGNGGSSARGRGTNLGNASSVESYLRQHEITVSGDDVPSPFISFESTGFPSEILREVRYLLQRGANVVRCGAVPPFLGWGGLELERPYMVDQFLRRAFGITQFVARAVAGDGSVCHLVRTEGHFLLLQLASASIGRVYIWGMITLFLALPIPRVQQAGFSAPTPIQAQSWPIALQSRDIVAVAKTGSGKTLGYLVPGFIHLKRCRNNSQMGPTVLVLSPTRELATQIQDEAVKFGRSSRISCTCLYGGAPKGPQLREIERGADIVVATPGRLNDILEMRKISLRQVSYLVLDEADRMLDMGFEPQIRKIVNEIPPRRQTLMYTATWPKEVRKIAADLLVKPVQVNIGNVDELVANKAITQHVELVQPMEKQRRLEQILRSQEPGSKVIIFCSTKKMCDQLTRTITRQFGAAAIHGDKSQGERDYVLSQFRSGKSPILVATDVAARGLDVKDIRAVINYDFPTGVEDYVHRIGRTGRAGATGVAYTFFSDQDAKYAADLIKVLEGANQRVPPQIRDLASRGGGMNRFRRWGSAPGGRDGSRGGRFESSFGGGRGGRGPPPSSERDGGRGYDREPRDRYDDDSRVSWHQRAYGTNSSDVRTGDKERVRSRSPNKGGNGGWGNTRRSRSRSRSLNRDRSRSRSRSRSPDRYRGVQPAVRNASPNVQRTGGSSPRQGSSLFRNEKSPPHESSRSGYFGEEEEEGMIPAEPDEEGMIPADDGGPRNSEEPVILD